MARDVVNVMIGGEAGQGLVTIGELLIKSLSAAGYRFVVTQDYMSRIRGGHNTFIIRASTGPIEAPRESIDVLVALNRETVELHRDQMAPDGLVIGDAAFNISEGEIMAAPMKDLAPARYLNTVALGLTASVLGLERDIVAAALEKRFGAKHPEAMEANLEALSRAYDFCSEKCPISHRLNPPAEVGQRLVMNGNEAIALGAMAAGLKFCAFYPMTPSTSIALNLTSRAEKMGLVVEQAEDEIAAVNMAVGASFAGAPAMVPTSGGGFALMTEGVSLAAITETPLVFAIVQRPGPATGLPTRTEQADLEFVLHSGHGEFCRAIFAPGTVEECFYLTRRAFDQAERCQTPVFILSDQYLADSFRAVDPFDLDEGVEVDPSRAVFPPDKKYKRYELSDNGVSLRLLPGMTTNLVVADSDEHTEDGHLTEDLQVRIQQMDKRLKKSRLLVEEALPPSIFGDEDPDLLLVCWGSTRGPAVEAAQILKSRGASVGVMHFAQVWPLNPDQFLERLNKAGKVVAVEGNATGQMARLIQRETGFGIKYLVVRYDGLPITPEYILRELN